jgi:hypothetical protein
MSVSDYRSIAVVVHKPASTLGLSALLIAFASGLIFQESRWSHTPAYANLLAIMPAAMWGLIHGVIGVILLASVFTPRVRLFAIAAHTLAFILLASWEAAFFVRWITDTGTPATAIAPEHPSGTTVANVLAWLTYIALCLRSASLIDVVARQAETVAE